MLHLADAFGFTDLRGDAEHKAAIALDCHIPTLVDRKDERLTFTPRQIADVARATAAEIFSVFFQHLESSTTLSVVQKSIAIVMPNSASLVFSVLGVTGLSMVACPMYSTLSTHEYKFAFTDMSIDLLIVGEEGNVGAQDAAKELNIPCATFTWNFDGPTPVPLIPHNRDKQHQAEDQLVISPKEFEICIKFHTAGVTKRPKLVPLTHRNVAISLANVQKTYAWHGYSGPTTEAEDLDVGLCVTNMAHVHGLIVGCLAPLACQSIVVLDAEFSSSKAFWDACVAHRVSWVTLLPSMVHTLMRDYESTYPKDRPPTFRFIRTTSSQLPPQLATEAEKHFNCPIVEAYSLTEATHQICSNGYPTVEDRKTGSVGKPTGTEVAILDSVDTKRCLPTGQVGEVWIRGWNVVDSYENMNKEQQQQEFLPHNAIDWYSAGSSPSYFSSAFDLSPGVHRSFSSLKSTARISRPTIQLPEELIPPKSHDTGEKPKPATNLIRFSSALEPYVSSDFPQRTEPLISPLPLHIQWLRSGDTGKMDSDGRLYLIARSKDIINRGGLKVSPKEVEDVFNSFPEIDKCVVFGVRHPSLGEVVHMAFIGAPGFRLTSATEKELLKRSTAKLAYFKVPEKLHPVNAFPTDIAGRILRDTLAHELVMEPSPAMITPMSP